ncbi:MAG: right-handed parallel beta-helix repeat-containing protein [Herminiimonas sp.]|nr:right-handed parallel beta-helix repeat-containing protein [Herminiimonas sp.]MDB5853106.1 right-handed parallel beta-helix repeat-containing protein [Herminiimonas sp.]
MIAPFAKSARFFSLLLALCGTVTAQAAGSSADRLLSAAQTGVTVRDMSSPPVSSAVPGTYPVSILPIPTRVASGSTVRLQCGRTYFGTLNLVGKYNVSVRTEGACGKASITPGQALKGWTREQGNIYSAPIPFSPAQVGVAGKMLELAHFPNRPQIWAKAKSDSPSTLQYAMPSSDLAGATVVYRPFEWMIETRQIQSYSNGVITLGPKKGDAYDPPKEGEFYVEGKLWMLDSPGEWAVEGGRLYVWAPDGRSPEGRVWVSPTASGIDATDSRGVTIDNVHIFAASIGIDGSNSTDLQVLNTEIGNSAEDAIFAGGRGLVVDNAAISDSVQNGILGFYGIENSIVTNSLVTGTGMVGMPKRSKGGIVFEQASGQRVTNNKVLNSSYIGIRVHKNAIVSGNLVDRACQILSDCGGIYTFAPDKQPLNVRIEGNTVKNLAQRTCYAVYLDDNANGVTVTRNTLINNPGGLEMNNGFDNIVSQNVFTSSGYEHILLNETGHGISIRRNQISGNSFTSTRGEVTYRLWSVNGGSTVAQFANYEDNTYSGSGKGFAEVSGTGMLDYNGWKQKMKQDGRSVMKAGASRTGSEAPAPRTALEKMVGLAARFIRNASWGESSTAGR